MAINFQASFTQFNYNSSSLIGGFINAGSAQQSTQISSSFASSFQLGGMPSLNSLFSGLMQQIFQMPPPLPIFGPFPFPGHTGPILPQPGGNGGINPQPPPMMRYGIGVDVINPDPPIKAVYGIMVNDTNGFLT